MDYNQLSDFDQSPEMLRERGKSMLISADSSQRSEGISCIMMAYSYGDSEATYLVGYLMLKGVLKPVSGDPEERALSILCDAAQKGNVQARSLLNSYCVNRYSNTLQNKETKSGPLVDFDGKPIVIKRKGVLTPVDAVLEYTAGMNVLTLNANILFLGDLDLKNRELFERSVLEGIKMWQGDYTVFGNQQLKVIVNLTTEIRIFDNVLIIPLTEAIGQSAKKFAHAIGTKQSKERADLLLQEKRSFASGGLKWTTKSRKTICIQSENGRFDDYEEIKHVAKHEFGHALGLGDLYKSKSDQLNGVDKGTYFELDGFYISNSFYNLVMCDHHGPISNNDIEMVVLAFRENKAQLYQPGNFKGVISKALGRGN